MLLQLCCGPGDETVVSGGYDQAVRVWDMRSRSFDPIQSIKAFADSVTAVLVTERCAAGRVQPGAACVPSALCTCGCAAAAWLCACAGSP